MVTYFTFLNSSPVIPLPFSVPASLQHLKLHAAAGIYPGTPMYFLFGVMTLSSLKILIYDPNRNYVGVSR